MRYHQNRVWTQSLCIQTWFWWYLTQIWTDLRDFLCVLTAISRRMWFCVGSAKTGQNRSCWTGFFAVFKSKKWKDRTDGPVFFSPGLVQLWSFSGPIDRTLKHYNRCHSKTRAITTAKEPDCSSVRLSFGFFLVWWTRPSNTSSFKKKCL